MNKISTFIFTLLIGLGLSLGGISDADAKRLGGGGSFGGKSAFSSPYKRSAMPARTAKQQQATQQNQAARQGLANRGGLMGMLGGLALGGLLGALLFGGAFENLNFMDILVFGGIAFLLYKLFAARAGARGPRPAYNPLPGPARGAPQQQRESILHAKTDPATQAGNSGFDTRNWFRGEQGGAPVGETLELAPDLIRTVVPAGFDEQAFLTGARIAFRDLQKAWDERDLAAIRGLTTDTMFSELQDRIKALAADNRTDVLKLEAELLEVRDVSDMLEAVVLFDAVMREDADSQARQVKEVWHFTKPVAQQQPKWYLDGIQQLED